MCLVWLYGSYMPRSEISCAIVAPTAPNSEYIPARRQFACTNYHSKGCGIDCLCNVSRECLFNLIPTCLYGLSETPLGLKYLAFQFLFRGKLFVVIFSFNFLYTLSKRVSQHPGIRPISLQRRFTYLSALVLGFSSLQAFAAKLLPFQLSTCN